MCLKNGGKNSVGTFSKKELFIMKQRKIMLKTIEDAKKFVNASIKCDFDIDVFYFRIIIDAKSILGLLSLDLTKTLTVKCYGEDEDFNRVLSKYAAG